MNSKKDLQSIIENLLLGSRDLQEIQVIIDAIKSKKIILDTDIDTKSIQNTDEQRIVYSEISERSIINSRDSERSAEIKDSQGSIVITGDGNIVVNGKKAETIKSITDHYKISQAFSGIFKNIKVILRFVWYPLLLRSGGLLLLSILGIGVLRLGQCGVSIECLGNSPVVSPSPTRSEPTSSSLSTLKPKDFISAGERILFKGNYNENYRKLKEEAIRLFSDGKYDAARKKFKEIREKAKKDKKKDIDSDDVLKDPELLIYQNNAQAMLRHEKGGEIYTIAVATPFSNSREKVFSVGQQILFGVAQAQDDAVNSPEKPINLKVIIADDKNNRDQAIEIAKTLTKDKDYSNILAVIGHYTSPITCATLPIYKEAELVVISSTSSRVDLRETCEGGNNFFRTTTSTAIEARTLSRYLSKRSGIDKPKVFAFYRKGEDFSQSLFEEFKKNLQSQSQNELIREFDLSKSDEISKALNSINESNVFAVFPDGRTGDSQAYKNAIRLIKRVIDNSNVRLILGSNPLYQEEIITNVGIEKLQNKLILAVEWPKECSNKSFVKKSEGIWSGGINRYTALSYEAVQALLDVFSSINPDSKIHAKNLFDTYIKSEVFEENIKIGFEKNGDRKGIISSLLVTPSNSEDNFSLVQGESCSRLTSDNP